MVKTIYSTLFLMAAVMAMSVAFANPSYAHCGKCGAHAEKMEKKCEKKCPKTGKCMKKKCDKPTETKCMKGTKAPMYGHNDNARYND